MVRIWTTRDVPSCLGIGRSLMIVDQVARNGQFLKFMTTLVGHWREEQRITGADAFFAKIGKCSKLVTSHIHCLYGVPLWRIWDQEGINSQYVKYVWKSLCLRLRSLITTWFMDGSDMIWLTQVRIVGMQSMPQRRDELRFRLWPVTCAEVPIYTHVAQAPGNPRRWKPFFGTWHILTRPFVRFLKWTRKRTSFSSESLKLRRSH